MNTNCSVILLQLLELILVDVANYGLWIDYYAPCTVLHYADRVSIERPVKAIRR